jgi:hypothetical protein
VPVAFRDPVPDGMLENVAVVVPTRVVEVRDNVDVDTKLEDEVGDETGAVDECSTLRTEET